MAQFKINIMKIKFLVLSLREQNIVESVHLSSDGLDVESNFAIVTTIESEWEYELDAIESAKFIVESNDIVGVEIRKIFTK